MILGKPPIEVGDVLQVTTPEGVTTHHEVSHRNGQWVWAGPHRIHSLDDRLPVPPGQPLTWRTHDGITFTIATAAS